MAASGTLLDVTGSRSLDAAYGSSSLGDYLQQLFNLAIVFGGVLAVVRITYAGFLYMTTDVVENKSKAKKALRDAALGLLLLLAIVLILRQINPDLLKLNVELKRIDAPRETTLTPSDSSSASFGEPRGRLITDVLTFENSPSRGQVCAKDTTRSNRQYVCGYGSLSSCVSEYSKAACASY